MKLLVNKENKGYLKTFILHGGNYFWRNPCFPCLGRGFPRRFSFISTPLELKKSQIKEKILDIQTKSESGRVN